MLGASESWGGLFFKELDFSGTCARILRYCLRILMTQGVAFTCPKYTYPNLKFQYIQEDMPAFFAPIRIWLLERTCKLTGR